MISGTLNLLSESAAHKSGLSGVPFFERSGLVHVWLSVLQTAVWGLASAKTCWPHRCIAPRGPQAGYALAKV